MILLLESTTVKISGWKSWRNDCASFNATDCLFVLFCCRFPSLWLCEAWLAHQWVNVRTCTLQRALKQQCLHQAHCSSYQSRHISPLKHVLIFLNLQTLDKMLKAKHTVAAWDTWNKTAIPSRAAECQNAPVVYRARRAATVHSSSSPTASSDLQPSHTNMHSSTFTHQHALNVYHTSSACYLVTIFNLHTPTCGIRW